MNTVLGYDAVGEIIEMGPGVEGFKVGQKVATFVRMGPSTLPLFYSPSFPFCTFLFGSQPSEWQPQVPYFYSPFPYPISYLLSPLQIPKVEISCFYYVLLLTNAFSTLRRFPRILPYPSILFLALRPRLPL